MAYSSHAVANAFLALAGAQGKQLTNMQLQKLVYIAQGFSLALLNKDLYFHNTHAWQWGPVIPKLYKSLQKYGAGVVAEPLTPQALGDEIPPDSDEAKIIQGVWEGYGKHSGPQLSKLTHQAGTPWSETWQKEPFGIIPLDTIKQHYREIVEARSR